jgi:hypothetical protein
VPQLGRFSVGARFIEFNFVRPAKTTKAAIFTKNYDFRDFLAKIRFFGRVW